jgi:hypothetical protein
MSHADDRQPAHWRAGLNGLWILGTAKYAGVLRSAATCTQTDYRRLRRVAYDDALLRDLAVTAAAPIHDSRRIDRRSP